MEIININLFFYLLTWFEIPKLLFYVSFLRILEETTSEELYYHLGIWYFCLPNWLMLKHVIHITLSVFTLLLFSFWYIHALTLTIRIGCIKDRVVVREFETNKLDFYALNDARVIYYIQPSCSILFHAVTL